MPRTPNKGALLSQVTLPSTIIQTQAIIAIPSRTLQYGLYAFVFSVTMDPSFTSQIFASSASTFVLIDPSPIIGAMLPGAMLEVQVGYAQTVCVAPATYSIDPDETGAQVRLLNSEN